MKTSWKWYVLLLLVTMQAGCVTQTERVPYRRYSDPPENESVLDEIRREFGWQKPPPWVQEEPLYKRAARGVKETLTGWLQEDKPTTALTGGFQSVEEFRRAQKEAIARLPQQKSGETLLDSSLSEVTGDAVSPGVRGVMPEQ
jgi:hypothetical protein